MISVLDIFRLRIADQYRERWRAWLNIKATLATTRGTDPQSSGSNVAGINRSRHVRIVCAFDDAAGVGEDCDLMPARFEFQQKAIVTHLAGVAHSVGEFGEIYLESGRRRDLNRVAPAQRRHKLPAPRGENIESPLPSGGTVLRAFMQSEPRGRVLPEIELQERPVKIFELTGQNLQRLGDLMRGDRGDDRQNHSRRVAGGRSPWRGHFRKDAAQTGRDART